MIYSKLATAVVESPTLRLNEEARILREKGESIIHLGIGEPKNKAPLPAILASASRLTSGEVKYAPSDGIPSLKKAILRYTEENYDKVAAPENVIVSAGAKMTLFNILFSVLNPQDEVILLAPYWVSYPEMVKMCYGVPVVVTPEDGSFLPRFADVERAVGSNTRAIILNSPNNPSGMIYPEPFLAEVIEFCERKGIWVIMDDIYHKLVFDGRRCPSPYSFTKKDLESTMVVVMNGVSKTYGMTGFRIGWVVTNRRLVSIINNVQAATTSCASTVLQSAAEGALTGMQSSVESLRLTIENNRNVILQELKTFRDVKCAPPNGTFYCLPDFRAYATRFGGQSVDLCKFLLDKARVVTVPGKEFGMEGHLRLSYAGTVKDVMVGIERIKWALDPQSPNEIYIGDRKVVRDWL